MATVGHGMESTGKELMRGWVYTLARKGEHYLCRHYDDDDGEWLDGLVVLKSRCHITTLHGLHL